MGRPRWAIPLASDESIALAQLHSRRSSRLRCFNHSEKSRPRERLRSAVAVPRLAGSTTALTPRPGADTITEPRNHHRPRQDSTMIGRLRLPRQGRRRHSRSEPGHRIAPRRRDGPLQPRMRLLHPAQERGSPQRSAESLGSGFQGSELGPPRPRPGPSALRSGVRPAVSREPVTTREECDSCFWPATYRRSAAPG
jgi:hypothetical protein